MGEVGIVAGKWRPNEKEEMTSSGCVKGKHMLQGGSDRHCGWRARKTRVIDRRSINALAETFHVCRRKETPMALSSDRQSNGKRHIYRSSIKMADELLQQAQELFEGQIVGRCLYSRLDSVLTMRTGF